MSCKLTPQGTSFHKHSQRHNIVVGSIAADALKTQTIVPATICTNILRNLSEYVHKHLHPSPAAHRSRPPPINVAVQFSSVQFCVIDDTAKSMHILHTYSKMHTLFLDSQRNLDKRTNIDLSRTEEGRMPLVPHQHFGS